MPLIKRFFCLLLVAFFLNLSFYPAIAQDWPPGEESLLLQDDDSDLPEIVDSPSSAEFLCSTPDSDPMQNVLLPNEVAKLKRLTEEENKGFVIDNINSGRGQNPERDVLENNIIVQTNNQGDSLVNELPDSKMDIGEISPWFNKWYSGPFAFGVSLDDTIRIGQCRNLDRLEAEKRGCPLTDKQLSYRNSGEGISANFKTVWEDVKSIFAGDETGQYTPEEAANLQLNIAAETDLNSLEAKFVQREVKHIPNSVKTEDFVASMATTGDDSGSLISIYSMFDKYFNSWFSTEMVVTTFGPTLIGQAKKYAGWMHRHGWPWTLKDNKFAMWFRRKFTEPTGLYGQARLRRMMTRTDKYGFGEAWTKGIEQTDWDSGYAFVKGGSFRKSVNEWSKPGGYLDEMTDPVMRGEFFKQIKDLRGYGHSNFAFWKQADDAFAAAKLRYGVDSPEARAALMDYAKTNARLMTAADQPYLRLDALELWMHEDFPRLYNVAVKQQGVEGFVPLAKDSKPIGLIVDGFEKGKWGTSAFPFETTQDGFMQFYRISDNSQFLEEVPIDDLRKNFSMFVDKAVKTEKGDFIKVDRSTVDYIAKETAGTGKVKVYKAQWAPLDPETPEMFAKRLTTPRANRVSKTLPANMDRLYNSLVERNFGGQARRYYNILDKAFAQEQQILKSYFSIKGGAKWTLLPFLYWEGKRGFGFEGFSAFQLPDNWKQVKIYTEGEEIFDDAFVDVLAQHGSDEGEIFSQVLEKLPWKMALNYASEKFSPVNDSYERITQPMSGWRRSVENVAYFTSTREECATCGVTLVPRILSQESVFELRDKGRGEAVISFNAEQDMKSYFVEDIIDESVKEDGTTLIAFGYHTNIKGEAIDDPGQEAEDIDLVQAKKDKTRCSDAIKEIGLGFLGENPQRAGAVLAFTESLGYMIFMWSGIMGSVIQQTLLVPKLQDCVDDVDGYFLHMYASYAKGKENLESGNELASSSAGDMVKDFSGFVLGSQLEEVKEEDKEKPVRDAQGQPFTPTERDESSDEDRVVFNRSGEEFDTKSFWEQAKAEIAGQAEKLSEKAQSSEILQLEVETMGETQGIVFFKKMFFFWFKGNTQQAVYDDLSQAVLEDNDKDVSVIVDKKAGEILVKKQGEPAEKAITSEDHVRLSGPDGRVPAEVIPQRIGRVVLPTGPGIPLFAMDWRGQFRVLEPSVLDCIKRNVEEQTGIPLDVDDITQAFGRVETIVTSSYPSITPGQAYEKIINANGSPRQMVHGDNARVVVMSDMNTTMLNDRQVPVGRFSSVQFKNGLILFKPATVDRPAELLIWIRYHEKSILRPSDVRGLRATVADPIINPETGCPEPAIDLQAIANTEAGVDSAITQRVSNFNKAISKMGPFQIFDTEKHRFVFYSEKTSPDCSPDQPGCCQERVTIINKETGEVYDQPIVGGINQTPTGISFKTADGKDHSLDFSADNGVPKISYNNMAPETLTMARGPNGGFWYDPEEELWRPYNAQMLPLIEAFKTRGFDTRHREDSSSSTLPGSNTMNVQFGGESETPFNLPSLPAAPEAMLLFVFALMGVICVARIKIEKKFRK